MDSARDVLLRMEALLKRIEKHLRPEGEEDTCPGCGSDDLVEIPGVMGEAVQRFRCVRCNQSMTLREVS